MNAALRHFLIALLALAQCCAAVAAEDVQPTALANGSGDRTIMVLFTPVTVAGPAGSSRLTNYRNRTGYYTSGQDRRLAEAISEDYRLELLTDWPITELDLVCAVLSIPDDRTVEEVIALMAQDERLQLVQRMQTFGALTHSDPYYPLQVKQYSIDLERLHEVTTGRKIAIAVIDTGVDVQHVDLAGQFRVSKNFAEDWSADFRGDRHGTAVAGIIAAKSHNDEGMVGIAPDAELLALKACWPLAAGGMESVCNTLTLALALNKAMMEGVNIINMSLAGPEDRIIGLLLERAIAKDVVVVAADAVKPGEDRFPASMPGVLAVSSVPAMGSDHERVGRVAAESTLAAPGTGILATAPSNTYDFFTGNSFAAAHVSGFAALLMQQCGTRDRHGLGRSLQLISKHLQAGEEVKSLSCHASAERP